MKHLLLSLLLVFSLIAVPVLASACAGDCDGSVMHQHEGAGKKIPDKSEKKADAAYHCCHVSTVAVLFKDARITPTPMVQKLPIGDVKQLGNRNPPPLLEPPSRT